MPLLRSFDRSRFDTIGEAVGFFTQIFEGLQFMHKNNVAHRDCTSMNIMMDGSSLYLVPFHPIRQHLKRDFSGKAPHLTRTQRPVKYYLTDFGLSRKYKPEERLPWNPLLWLATSLLQNIEYAMLVIPSQRMYIISETSSEENFCR
ncbi:hypothetical protein B0H10DRAFT_1175921 [Mycena sp. CBHHK59/15]|nr:hypothetical protein B0H10DRAFT_1175921 [Mycena sp. CBHHK59/15]